MLLKSLTLSHFLSFGPKPQRVELLPLNVMIGPWWLLKKRRAPRHSPA